MRATTDSNPAVDFASLGPGVENLLNIYQAFSGRTNDEMRSHFSGMRYGEHGAALANLDVGNHLIRTEGIRDLVVAGRVGKIEYCVGLSREKVSEKQAAKFNAALQQLIRSGKVREIARKYGIESPS